MTHYVDKPCQHCGKMMCGVTIRTKYHPDCYVAVKRKISADYFVEHREEINAKQKQKMESKRDTRPPMHCQTCGVLIVGRKRKYCPACAKIQSGANRKIESAINKASLEAIRPKQKPKAPRKKPLRHCWDLSFKSATQVQVEARALGLTYGKYSMLIDTLMIERYLANEGITDGLDRIDKAWRDFKREKKAQAEADKRRTAEYWGEVDELYQL